MNDSFRGIVMLLSMIFKEHLKENTNVYINMYNFHLPSCTAQMNFLFYKHSFSVCFWEKANLETIRYSDFLLYSRSLL